MSEQKEKRNFLSLDLEMNQPSGKIIQIGAVVGDIITGDIVDRIRIYVNPNEPLLEYIVNLCGISQADVDSGDDLVSAYNKLKSFHQKHDCFMNPITWGGGDSDYLLNQLKEEDKDIKWCFGRRWIDVKTIVFSHKLANGFNTQGGLAKSMTKYRMAFKGRKHDALDDAENTFVLYHYLLKNMFKDILV